LPSWLISPVIEPRLKELGIFNDAPHGAPNHVLVNEYHPGQGIMPHEDGAAYYPLVATVSLGAPIVLDLFKKDSRDERDDKTASDKDPNTAGHTRKPQYRILQERRSLLITRADLYTDYLHGIAETTRDEDLSADTICNWHLLREKDPYRAGWYQRETRTSLTYRDVLKVAKMGNSLKFLSGR
jgi:alkylated DNA repair protein alkB family protein 6